MDQYNNNPDVQTPFYIRLIAEELAKRTSRNHRFSQRAFARQLGVHNSCLSRTLKFKRGISNEVAERICVQLRLPLDVKLLFMESVVNHRKLLRKQRTEIRNSAVEMSHIHNTAQYMCK